MSNGESCIQMFRNGRMHYVSAYSGFTLQLNFIGAPPPPVYDEHVRLGHVNRHKLLYLSKHGFTRTTLDPRLVNEFQLADCSACSQFKAVRAPKTASSWRGTAPGEMIHLDIVGPFSKSTTGKQYAVVLFDDFTQISHVQPLTGKTGVLAHIQAFVARIERQCNTKVRFLRSDNGSEFLSKEAQCGTKPSVLSIKYQPGILQSSAVPARDSFVLSRR